MHIKGYRKVQCPGHPRADLGGYVLEHILKAEIALSKPLPQGAEIHHVNERRLDNANSNLVVCGSHGYHMLLEARGRALRACGHADWVRCSFCGQYGAPGSSVYTPPGSSWHYHRECRNARRRKSYHATSS